MITIFLVGLVVAVIAVVGYFVATKKSNSEYELSWKKCILTGLSVYFLSLFLGSLSTSVYQHSNNFNLNSFLENVILQTLGFLFYSVAFSFFIVLPVLILGFKFMSKTSLSNEQKQQGFVGISFILVAIMNAIMTGFFSNIDFMLFLAGYSFFGIVTSWFFAWRVFNEENYLN